MENILVPFFVGLGFIVVGVLNMTNLAFIEWGLSHNTGRIWVKLPGKERAIKLTKYFFGPLVIVIGTLSIIIAAVALFTHK